MQFTGLKDRTGREIYEGDIVECKDSAGYEECYSMKRGEVVYHAERGAWIFHDPENYNELLFQKSTSEIIGNIYENPELL